MDLMKKTHTWQRIASQPEVWGSTLDEFGAGQASNGGGRDG